MALFLKPKPNLQKKQVFPAAPYGVDKLTLELKTAIQALFYGHKSGVLPAYLLARCCVTAHRR